MPSILPDASARAEIISELSRNIVVEAAAGTGKTTCMVGRVCEMIRENFLSGDHRFAAVTFTLKAANELKQRLHSRLGAMIADAPPPEADVLARGRDALAECHIGTIHSFCARLLRERPVEAAVNPNFRELEQDEDDRYRRRAWDDFRRLLVAGRHTRLTDDFRTFGLDLDTLGEAFVKFAEYPDVDRWTGDGFDSKSVGLENFRKGLEEFTAALGGYGPLLEKAVPEKDALIPILQTLSRRQKRGLPDGVREAHRLASLFKPNPNCVQKQWKSNFGFSPDEMREHQEKYLRFHAETVKPFRADCMAAVYAAALAAFRHARDIYDRLRFEDGVLNFQDLLMKTAAVLRDYPDVRRELSSRFNRLLVDEVQDTDPIQAEILLLLASADDAEKDWRKTVPRPGSLFIVGDPKQSIYRFRRADIVIYQELKDIVVRNGGLLLNLVANFRSQPVVLDWVNAAFGPKPGDFDPAAGIFSSEDIPHSPAYVPLAAGREAATADLTGVFRLETLKESRKADSPVDSAAIMADEAARIARFIRHAVDAGRTVPDGDGVRPAAPGDFMIVTPKKDIAPIYAAALGRLGVEAEVSAGGALKNSPALDLLRLHLAALANPDDPVAVLAVLRGPLNGVSDRDLYRWKKADFPFLFPYAPAPERLETAEDPEALETIRRVLATLREHHRLFRHLDPVDCLDRITDDLGLWAYASLGDDPSAGTGALFTALELLRAEQGSIAGPGALLERFDWLREKYDGDVVPSLPPGRNAVRVMNVHKTKGLEAPVVFLTSNVGAGVPARSAVSREGGSVVGGMALMSGPHGNVPIACPPDWEAMAAGEELFLAAEKTRLNYVAATRAGSMLVVSVRPTSKELKSKFLPAADAAELLPDLLPEPDGPPPAPAEADATVIDAASLAAASERRAASLAAVRAESYSLERAKPDHVDVDQISYGPAFHGEEREDSDPELAADTGEILHRLLESDHAPERLRDDAAAMLREFARPVDLADSLAELALAVRGSEIWRRAAASDRCFREMPFTIANGAVLQRGVIDLVFRENNGWVIVDYKSDRIPEGADPVAAAQRHAGQLAAYRRAWEKSSGEKVSETLVFFVRSGQCVSIPLKNDL